MGVIDLDARVKKLEEGGTGGAVIDQLEAEVTALDEQINGNGETSFGLAGDVSDLKTAAVPVQYEIEVESDVSPDSANGGCYYTVIGNLVFVHVAVDSLTANTALTVGTLPSAVRPSSHIYAVGVGFDQTKWSRLVISYDTGVITIRSEDTKARAMIMYPINEVTPTP